MIPFCPQAVLFDMDGVITDTMPRHFQAWRQVFAEEGIFLTELDVYLREGEAGTDSAADFLRRAGRSDVPEEVSRLVRRKEEVFSGKREVRLFPGAQDLILELRSRGVPQALVTGTSRHEVEQILPVALMDCFQSLVTGDRVVNGKPHPEPYLTAIQDLGAEAALSLAVENAPFGVKSARAAGAFVVTVSTSLPPEHLTEADLTLESLVEVRRLLLSSLRSD